MDLFGLACTLSGVTKADHVYEVMSTVEVAGEINDVEDSTIIIKDGRQLRFGNNADMTFRNCLTVEEPYAYSPSGDNYQV